MDHVEIDVDAVAGDNSSRCSSCPSVKTSMSYRASPWAASDRIDDAGDSFTVDEHVGDLQVTVRERREFPRPKRSLRDAAVTRNEVGRKDAVRDEPLAFAVEARCIS